MKKSLLVFLVLIITAVAPQAHAIIRNPASTDDVAALQKQIDQLNSLNAQLQSRVQVLESRPVSVATNAPVQIVQDTARIEKLEQRVGVLEGIVNTIKSNVMAALQTTIGLLQKLLAK